MRKQYESYALAHQYSTEDYEFLKPKHKDMPQHLFTTKSDFSTTVYRRNKYGLPDLRAKYGDLAPTKPTCLEPKYGQIANYVPPDADYILSFQSAKHDKSVNDVFSVCLDTGCSIGFTYSLDDFEEPPVAGAYGSVKTMNDTSTAITAFGVVAWRVVDQTGREHVVRSPAYFVPNTTQRLLSPQAYAQFQGWDGPDDCYAGNNKRMWLLLNSMNTNSDGSKTLAKLEAPIAANDRIPYFTAWPLPKDETVESSSATKKQKKKKKSACQCQHCNQCFFASMFNIEVLNESNENLSEAQKELLLDHQRLGHLNMEHVQNLFFVFFFLFVF